jgi:hypothetical protein
VEFSEINIIESTFRDNQMRFIKAINANVFIEDSTFDGVDNQNKDQKGNALYCEC